MNEQDKLDIEQNDGPGPNANMKEPAGGNSKHDEWTIESLKQELCTFNLEIAGKYRRADQMLDQRANIADEIDAMDALLQKHKIKFVPQISLVSKNGNNCWDDKSLFERNVVIRQSLRKPGDGSTFKMVTYGRDDLDNERESLLTTKEAVEWLRRAGATEEEIFTITGEKPCSAKNPEFYGRMNEM